MCVYQQIYDTLSPKLGGMHRHPHFYTQTKLGHHVVALVLLWLLLKLLLLF